MAEATVEEVDAAAAPDEAEAFEYEHGEGRSDDAEAAPAPAAKKSLADLAAEAPPAEGAEPEADGQVPLFGTERKVTGSVRGPKPKSSHVSFTTAECEVNGQFHPEDVVELRMVVELSEVAIKYRRKGGQIVDTRRVHKAKAVRVEQLNLPPELILARHQHVADALGVDVNDLIAATEAAVSSVTLPG